MLDAFTTQQILWTAACIVLAYVVRGMSGFGAGLVATPLLAFMLPLQVIVPLNGLLVIVLFAFLTVRDREHVIWGELKLLALPTLIGVLGGLLLFRALDNRVLLLMLGTFLIVYASYMLLVHTVGLPPLRCSQKWAAPAGFAGAFADTLFGGGGGTMVVIYMHARGMSRIAFRSTVAVLWFGEMIARVTGYAAVGYYTADVLMLALLVLPCIAIGTWIGERLGNRISQAAFSRVLAVLLMLSGVSLLLK